MDNLLLESRIIELAERAPGHALAELLDSLPAAVYTTDAEGTVTFFNRAAAELAGRTPQIGQDRWCITWRLYRPDGTHLPHDSCPMAIALRERRPVRGMDVVAERPDGTRVPLMPFPTPLYDSADNFCGAVNLLVEISDRKRAEELSARRMHELSALYQFTDKLQRAASLDEVYCSALDAIVSGLHCNRASILLFDAGGVMRFVAARGLSEDYQKAVEGHSPWKPGERDPQPIVMSDIDLADVPQSLKDTVKGEGIRALAFIPLLDERGTIGKFMTYYDMPHVFSADEVKLAVNIARQLAFGIERKRTEEHQKMLLDELSHRVKNTLATMQSMVSQTLRNARSTEQAREQFEQRLLALSKAHDILIEQRWEGAPLRAVVMEALAPYCAPRNRFDVEGPDVWLSAKHAVTLAMGLHELCTNAVKYGALSNDSGRVELSWTVTGVNGTRRLNIRWIEKGGPPVEPPAHRGFGSRLIERGLRHDLAGDVEVDFAASGLVCVIDAPLESVQATDERRA